MLFRSPQTTRTFALQRSRCSLRGAVPVYECPKLEVDFSAQGPFLHSAGTAPNGELTCAAERGSMFNGLTMLREAAGPAQLVEEVIVAFVPEPRQPPSDPNSISRGGRRVHPAPLPTMTMGRESSLHPGTRCPAPLTHSPPGPCANPLCDIPSGCCFFTGPWTVTRSSLRMLRRVAAFCRPLQPVLLLVLFPRSRSPVVGVPGLCWM